MENKETKKKISYGLLVAIGCFLIQAIPFGIASNIHPQFLGYIIAEEGFKLGAISAMFTIGTIISAVCSPTIGNLFNKMSAKIIFTVGAILSAGGIFILGIAGSKLPLFYLGYAISQIGTSAISSIGVPVLLTSWFDDKSRGKAMGIVFAGGGLGNIFLQQLSATWLNSVGYAQAYQNFAILSLAVGVVVSLLLIRMPKNETEVIKGKEETQEIKENKEETQEIESKWGYTFAEARKLKSYWIFAIGFVFVGIYVSALATQYSAYLKAENFDPKMLGMVGSTFALFSLFGNLIGGSLYDKFGAFKTTIVGLVLAVVACISIMLAPKVPALAYLYGASKGLSVFSYIIAPSMLTGILFGKKEFGAILAITQVFFALGFALGSAIFGVLVDIAGYGVAWFVILGAILVAYAMLLSVIKTMSNLNKEKFGR